MCGSSSLEAQHFQKMMARVGSVGTEAISQRETISSLSSVIRDHRMAMGSTSRRDRLLGLGNSSEGANASSFNEASEFKEEDVWASAELINNNNNISSAAPPCLEDFGYVENPTPSFVSSGRRWLGVDSGLGLSTLSRNPNPSQLHHRGGMGRVTSASRMIPQMVSAAGSENLGRKAMHQSAPVNVPDWSRIVGGKKSKNRSSKKDENVFKDGGEEGGDGGEDEDGELSVERLPPHELVARSQTTTFSVFEGAGRTLKGRDLSRVRNAVLKQTGFL